MAKPEPDQPVHDFVAPTTGVQTIWLYDFRLLATSVNQPIIPQAAGDRRV